MTGSETQGRWFIPLAQTPSGPGEVGGKACALGMALRGQLPVPGGFCLPSDVMQRAITYGGMSPEIGAFAAALAMAGQDDGEGKNHAALIRQGRDLGSRLRVLPLPPQLSAACASIYASLCPDDAAVAVRSSALQEDSADASFAGQHETVLGVRSPGKLEDAIRQCWASLFSEAALRYRLNQRRCGKFGMGVLIQRLIAPRAAGVLFTVNPMNGSRREMILEAGWGLGEAYVSGHASADTFWVARPMSPRRRVPLRILHQVIVPKERRLVATEAGATRWEPVEPSQRDQPTLTPEEVEAVGQLGLAAERLFGGPRDVEWALDERGALHLLQARPITTEVSPDTHRKRRDVLWTSRFSGERWTGVASPLGWSIIAPILHHFVYFNEAAKSHLSASLPTRLYRGFPYFNITIFRHLLFKLPGSPPPQFMLEFFPREEQDEILRAPWIWPDISLFAAVIKEVYRERRWERFAWQPLSNHRVWDDFLPVFEARIATIPEDPPSLAACDEASEACRALIVDYIGIHVTSLAFASIFYQILDVLLRRWAGRADPALLSALIKNHAGNKTVETNLALWELAQSASRCPQVAAALADPEHTPRLEHLTSLPDAAPFAEAMSQFLKNFGHRSIASWEIFSPRWIDQPSIPLGVIQGWLGGGLARSPEHLDARTVHDRGAAETEILAAIAEGAPPGRRRLRVSLFKGVLGLARSYSLLRENQRFYFDKLLLKTKRIYEKQGEHMAAAGLLAKPEDIVSLTQEEVIELCQGFLPPEDAAAVIHLRRRARAEDETMTHPAFLRGEEQCLDATPTSGRTLTGLGISPGRITGKVRIIRTLAEGLKLRRGDILVTRATDPGWTPLFLTAGGLIMELGSVLSHGAVVAREYHLPAVVNISDATRLLKDGQTITLDGDRGLIYLH